MTWEDVATELKVTSITVQRWVKGINDPTLSDCVKLAALFNVRLCQLFDDGEPLPDVLSVTRVKLAEPEAKLVSTTRAVRKSQRAGSVRRQKGSRGGKR